LFSRARQSLRTLVETWMLPQRCLFCGAAHPVEGICVDCRLDLPGSSATRCPVCANQSIAAQVCGECLARPPGFSRIGVAVSYRFPVDAAILRLKYGNDLTVAEPFAALLAERVADEPRPDLIVPMPMSSLRLRERGFNQALEIARGLSARLDLKLATELCRRTRHTPPQASLPWDERHRNIRGAFACEADLAGARVAVVDDVLTTGATVNELARVLLRAGAAQVVGWVVARTERTSWAIDGS
jgi:ComF family protein